MNLVALIGELQGERQWLEVVIQALETAPPDDPLLKKLLRDLDAVTRPGGALRLDDRKKLELFRQAEQLTRKRRRPQQRAQSQQDLFAGKVLRFGSQRRDSNAA